MPLWLPFGRLMHAVVPPPNASLQHPLHDKACMPPGNPMQDNLMQAQTQPFLKLAQANMDLLTRFSVSPEVLAQTSANASQLLQQAGESAMKLMQSSAMLHVMQGMLKNYTEFLADISQSGMSMLSQGQAAMTRQVQEASEGVMEAATTRGRRAR